MKEPFTYELAMHYMNAYREACWEAYRFIRLIGDLSKNGIDSHKTIESFLYDWGGPLQGTDYALDNNYTEPQTAEQKEPSDEKPF